MDNLELQQQAADKFEEKSRSIDINLSYPFDPDYEYTTRLERINLDEERELDIITNKGFIVAPTQGIKKDIKNPFSIYSSKFGQTIKDVNPFGNRYKCECGYTQQKVNNGVICKICGKPVRYVDDDYNYFGWIVLKNHYIIAPAFYQALRSFIGKDFDEIIHFDCIVDDDGNQYPKPKPKDKPYYYLGLIEFREKFDEIMEYYKNKNKKKIDKYNDIMANREKVFTQSIPVYTALLRPFDIDRFTCSYESTNSGLNMVNKYVTALNSDSNFGGAKFRIKSLNQHCKIERKPTLDLLWRLQLKLDDLYDQVIEIIKGKKGNIRTLFGGRCNFVTRNVITADPSLRINQVKLPYAALVELLQQSIINILTKTYNLSYSDAYQKWYYASIKKDKVILDIINSIIYNALPDHKGLPVIINRNPTIAYGSILAMYCIGCSDESDKFEYIMKVPLQILPLLAADFDGDVLNCLYVINRAFWERANEIFNPRNVFYISRNDGLFNNDVNHQKDTLVNATQLVELGQENYTEDDLNNVLRIKSKWA